MLLVPLGFCLWWLWQRRPPAQSAFDDALDRALAPVIEQRGAQAKLGAITSNQARLLSRQVALDSVRYLTPRDLELWADVRRRAAASSPAACARLWKGADEALIGSAIAALGDDTLTDYTEMLARGFALRMDGKAPAATSANGVERGVDAVLESLPAAERSAFEADMRRPDVTDARACQLYLTLAAGAARLEPPRRSDYYRALSRELVSAP